MRSKRRRRDEAGPGRKQIWREAMGALDPFAQIDRFFFSALTVDLTNIQSVEQALDVEFVKENRVGNDKYYRSEGKGLISRVEYSILKNEFSLKIEFLRRPMSLGEITPFLSALIGNIIPIRENIRGSKYFFDSFDNKWPTSFDFQNKPERNCALETSCDVLKINNRELVVSYAYWHGPDIPEDQAWGPTRLTFGPKGSWVYCVSVRNASDGSSTLSDKAVDECFGGIKVPGRQSTNN